MEKKTESSNSNVTNAPITLSSPLASRTKILRPAGMRRCPAVTSRPSKSPAIQPKSRAPGHKATDPEIIMKGRKTMDQLNIRKKYPERSERQ